MNDVVFHSAHHADPRLKTWRGRKTQRLRNTRRTRLKKLLETNSHKFLSAPASACSWWMEPCRWDTARLSSGSRCCPCSSGLHQYCGSGSTSSWDAQRGTGPSGATLSHHRCRSLDTLVQQKWLLTERCCPALMEVCWIWWTPTLHRGLVHGGDSPVLASSCWCRPYKIIGIQDRCQVPTNGRTLGPATEVAVSNVHV